MDKETKLNYIIVEKSSEGDILILENGSFHARMRQLLCFVITLKRCPSTDFPNYYSCEMDRSSNPFKG
jgi:hypothetical protein